MFHAIEGLSAIGHPVCAAVGFFDGVHLGHSAMIRQFAEESARLGAATLLVTFANSPRAYHLGDTDWKYLSLPDEKLHLLESQPVDYLLMLEYGEHIACQSAKQFFEGIGKYSQLKAICAGYDSSVGNDMVTGRDGYARLARSLGAELVFVDPWDLSGVVVKSSLVRELVSDGDMAGARELLGHPYLVEETVRPGKGKGGSELHIPTANLYPQATKLCPPTGIYAAYASIDGRQYPAATCVMDSALAQATAVDRETLANEPADPNGTVIEAHVVGYEGSLYGGRLSLRFLDRLRGWVDFDSKEALAAQIRQDIDQTCTIYGNLN